MKPGVEMKLLLGLTTENEIRFIDESTGDAINPISIFQLMSVYTWRLTTSSRMGEIRTRRKEFGARAEGVETVVGYREYDIQFRIEIDS